MKITKLKNLFKKIFLKKEKENNLHITEENNLPITEENNLHITEENNLHITEENKIEENNLPITEENRSIFKGILRYIDNNTPFTINELLRKEINIIDNPIFVVGCGHSGTSILKKLIGNHSNIYNIKDESNIFEKISDKKIRLKIYKLWSYICKNEGKERWVEKTPTHIFSLNTIFDDFPKAKVIIITRHIDAVSYSIKKRMGNIEYGLEEWSKNNIEWYNNENKSKCLIIKYEDLIKNTSSTFHTICNYVDEPYQDLSNTSNNTSQINLLTVPHDELINGKKHCNLRKWQINQPLYDNSEESMNQLTNDDKLKIKNYKFKNYTINDILKLLLYIS